MRSERSPVSGLSTIWRSLRPTSVSPGSKVSSAVNPSDSSQSRSLRDWVDLPDPSPPSKHTKTPDPAYTPLLMLTRYTLGRDTDADARR